MEAISNTESKQTVTPPVAPAEETDSTEAESEFELFLRGSIAPNGANEVCEEDLFAAIVQERVQKLKGEEGLTAYKTAFSEAQAALRKPDGTVSLEDAAKTALQTLQAGGSLTEEEAGTIYSQSFKAAQLDENTAALFDGRGSANDPTRAVASLEAALLGARTLIEQLDGGSVTAEARSVSEESYGHNMPIVSTEQSANLSVPTYSPPSASIPDVTGDDSDEDKKGNRRQQNSNTEL